MKIHYLSSALCVVFPLLVALTAGCSGSESSSGGQGGTAGTGGIGGTAGGESFQWPPDATAYFDQYGILNADCATDEDCAMVLGYYHARDRFVQMDLKRRFVTGAITSIVNKALLELVPGGVDALVTIAASNRAIFSNLHGEPLEQVVLQTTSPKTLGLLEAYAAGVNQWLDDVRSGNNDAQWPREFQSGVLDYQPEDAPNWSPSDSFATGVFLVEYETNFEDLHYSAAAAREKIDDPVRFSDLWSHEPVSKSSILEPEEYQASQASASVPKHAVQPVSDLVRRAGAAIERLRNQISGAKTVELLGLSPSPNGDGAGSNSWVLGPSKTANGGTLLSNDPHITLSQPAVWYLSHLDAKTHGSGDIHVAGINLPGLPFTIAGRNERTAWGLTNSWMDFSDVYVEELIKDEDGQPLGAMLNGEVIEFIKVEKTFTFNDGSTTKRTLLFHPVHGPVRSVDLENNVALTVRWTGQDVTTDLDFFTDAARANSVEEFRAAAENVTSIGQCWSAIDRDGNFGWFPYNRVPKRTWAGEAPSWLPLEGTGAYEWDDYFALSELPQALNRKIGYVVTTNNDMIGALADGDPTNDGHPPFQTDVTSGFRHERIVELLEQSDAHTMASMQTIVGDTRSLYGRNMTPKLLEIADDAMMPVLSANAQKVINALRPWTYDCPTGLEGSDPVLSPLADGAEVQESAGCAAFHVLFQELDNALANDEPHKDWFVLYFSVVNPTKLAAEDVYWDDVTTAQVETKFDTLATALEAAGETLVERLGADETKWAWGRMHGTILRSDLSDLNPLFNEFNNPLNNETFYATPGGFRTVNVASPGPDGLHTGGASTRFICEGLPEGLSCTIQLPGGQSSHADSPNYDDLLPLWLRNEPIELVFDIDQAKANAVSTVTFD